MEFEGQYLTYEEYEDLVEDLGGSAMDETPFNLLEFESRRRIDIRTQNRLKEVDSQDIPQEVKLCIYKLINSINDYADSTNSAVDVGNVASESTDGYSVSYVNSTQIKEIINSKNTEIEDIIRSYLLGVIFDGQHLMYVGVN